MSEYIVRGAVPNHTVRVEDEREVYWHMTHLPVLEEIVRCRDCEHFNDYHFKCHRPAHIIDAHGNLYWQSEGLMSVTDAGPDGYCAWGERRDA